MDLTIIMPLYNREKYIAQALDSILMQETKYSYKILICDDKSTDSSLQIAREYEKKYGDKIKIMESTKNQKLLRNTLRAYKKLDTPYFTVLDPDDYWISKNKIESGLDFLEKNADFSIYSGNTMMKFKDGEKKYFDLDAPKDGDFNDVLKGAGIFPHTSSAIFRNCVFSVENSNLDSNLSSNIASQNGGGDLIDSNLDSSLASSTVLKQKPKYKMNPHCKLFGTLPASAEYSYHGDSFRNIIHLNKGKIHIEPLIDSVYRILDSGIWQSMSNIKQHLINAQFYKDMYFYFDSKYSQLALLGKKIFNRLNPHEILLHLDTQNIDELFIYKDLSAFYDDFKLPAKKPNLKYKIFLNLHKKLDKKLKNKGFI